MLPHYAQAAEINVDGDCTLDEAIQSANDDAAQPGCEAGSGDDTIYITEAGTTNGVIAAGGLSHIVTNLIIDGNNFTVNTASGAQLGIYSVTAGTVTIRNQTISSAIDSRFAGNALYVINSGTNVTLSNVTFDNNTSTDGGALYVEKGSVNITNSTFSNNTAKNTGGAIFVTDSGAVVNITNSTFSGNLADDGGAIFLDNGSLTLTHVTIANNNYTDEFGSGGVRHAGGTLNIRNSILANNGADNGRSNCFSFTM